MRMVMVILLAYLVLVTIPAVVFVMTVIAIPTAALFLLGRVMLLRRT